MSRPLPVLGLVALVGWALVACEQPQPVALPGGSGLWVAPGTFTHQVEASRQLGAFPAEQIGHLLIDIGYAGWREGNLVAELLWPEAWRPDRPFVLALRLDCEGVEGEMEATREALAELVVELVGEAERRRLTPLGLHLQLQGLESPRRVASSLQDLRRHLPGEWSLSLGSLDPRLDAATWERLGEVADLIVPTIYGQDPSLPDVPEAWDLRRVEQRIRSFAGLERSFMGGIVTVGSVTVAGPGGEVLRVSTTTSFREVARAAGMRSEVGFAWEGVDRQVHSLRTTAPVQLSGLGLVEQGSRLLAVQTTSFHLTELLRRVSAWSPPGFQGVVLYRLALPGEKTALSSDELARSIALQPREAVFETGIERVGGSRRAPILHATLEGRQGGRTDLTFHESNLLELRAVGGGFFSAIQLGDFDRFSQLRLDQGQTAVLELRRPEILRFYFAILEEGEVLTAGPVRWHPASARSRVVVEGQVVLPAGRIQRLPPAEFPGPAAADQQP